LNIAQIDLRTKDKSCDHLKKIRSRLTIIFKKLIRVFPQNPKKET
jgi:hypothetical protein